MRIHLIRHGEVHNPEHLVYANLPGFTLSERGRQQAASLSDRLAEIDLAAIVSSPLERAVATAFALSTRNGTAVTTDERLTEWELGARWAGVKWEALPEVFPGELEAYLDHPDHLEFSPESLKDMAHRITATVCEWAQLGGEKDVAFVSHQDPIHGAMRLLTGAGFADYHHDKPEHCSVSTLTSDGGLWSTADYWAPEQ